MCVGEGGEGRERGCVALNKVLDIGEVWECMKGRGKVIACQGTEGDGGEGRKGG